LVQLEHIEAIEKRLWNAADTLRANSNYASNEYFLPVMGLIFLRYAYSRYLAVKDEIEAHLPKRGGKTRPLTKEDFSQKRAIFLRPEAQFDYLVSLSDSEDRAQAIIRAMESIEADYENLRGVLPKSEYQELDNAVLGQLLRTLNPEELKKVKGDVFGRIYEYFLTQFADQKAHDGGEFFTPISLVSLIANVLEPEKGIVLDPACGSGGMFVQSARVVERRQENPSEKLTFYGLEKNATTIRLAKMNLAVHGLEGNIQRAITYYEDPHDLVGLADYVMANPPFNVDEIDADKIKNDPRLPFGLPGVNKKGKVSNGNYVWISYFYSYLNERGRAGFVMSSQASSAGRDEAKVRRKLIETGAVEIMIAIRSNFFYTRTVPCELWFLNRAKPEDLRDKVLMIDARNIYRKVTRKIYDFSPEQMQNILAIVWLYRGQQERFLRLVENYCRRTIEESAHCFKLTTENREPINPTEDFRIILESVLRKCEVRSEKFENGELNRLRKNLSEELDQYHESVRKFQDLIQIASSNFTLQTSNFSKLVTDLQPIAEASRDLIKRVDSLYKTHSHLLEFYKSDAKSGNHNSLNHREITGSRRAVDEARQLVVEQLKKVRYFWKQAHWLVERFPEAKLRDVEGLVKVVTIEEIAANDWSLTPGRYVGVAPEEEDPDFDFAEALREIHTELEELNAEAAKLAVIIRKNFEGLGI